MTQAGVAAPSGSQDRPKRPAAVTIIGWMAIVVGGFMVLGGVMGLAAFSLMRTLSGGSFPPSAEGMPLPFRNIASLFRYFDILVYLQLGLAVFVIACGAAFLKLRAWARASLEMLSWLGMAGTVAYGIFWTITWRSAAAQMPVDARLPDFPQMFTLVGTVVGVLVTLTQTFAFAVVIWFLRSRQVREAVR